MVPQRSEKAQISPNILFIKKAIAIFFLVFLHSYQHLALSVFFNLAIPVGQFSAITFLCGCVCVCVCMCNKVLLKYKGDRESF